MNFAAAPILLPLLTGILLLLWTRPTMVRRLLTAVAAVVQIVAGAVLMGLTADGTIITLPIAGWAAPHGIVLVVDLLGALMITFSAVVAFGSILASFAESTISHDHPLRLPLIQFLVVGANLAFITGDLFNLFVAFEVLLIASYALMTLEADDFNVRETVPYVMVNLFGSALFIVAAGLTYSLVGTLNLAQIAERVGPLTGDIRFVSVVILLTVVAGIKTGLFPFYNWLHGSYPALNTGLCALYAGIMTKVGAYVLIRLYATIVPAELSQVHHILAWVAVATVLLGGFGAISRNYIRGILSWHILNQIGYISLGVALAVLLGPEAGIWALAAAIFHLLHNMLVKASLFIIGGSAARLNLSDDLARMGNLWRATPWLGMLFLFQALSLAGIPPLSGFWGKFLLFRESAVEGYWIFVASLLIGSLITLFSMIKIWLGAFWPVRSSVPVAEETQGWRGLAWSAVFFLVAALILGLMPEPFLNFCYTAAETALDREGYINAVLNSGVGRPVAP